MINDAEELSLEQSDATIQGQVASWIELMGKTTGAYQVAKGAIVATILNTGMLELTQDSKGNYIIKASAKWKQVNGKYESRLAENIHKLLKIGSGGSTNPIKRYLSKYNNTPSGMLRQIIGMKPGTNKISFGKVANNYSNTLVLDDAALQDYKMKVDWKRTTDQLTDAKQLKSYAKKIPGVGLALSFGFNSAEFYSDDNNRKSLGEKSGRFVAGLGVDGGVAGLTTVGAMVGSAIFPGVGTVIGGAIGATAGIVGSIFFEDKVKYLGESAGRWVEDTGKGIYNFGVDAVDNIADTISGAGKFLSGIFN